MKLGDKCVLAGHDGCVVTGFMEIPEGDFVRVKTTQNEDWHPADSVKVEGFVVPVVVVGKPKHYSEVENVEPAKAIIGEQEEGIEADSVKVVPKPKKKLDPMKSDGIVA